MTADGKPYRVYQSGRLRGKRAIERNVPPEPGRSGHGRRRRGIAVLVIVAIVIAAGAVWGALSYRALSSGVEKAGARIERDVREELSPTKGSLLDAPATILVLGTDGGVPGRESDNRSDSMMLIRTDPTRHRIAFLSIPRDLQVEIPEHGVAKVNSASQWGGPALAVRTVAQLTGLRIHHVVIVDFARFPEVIDALGGVVVHVQKPILSSKFDCPLKTTEACWDWEGWRFERGPQRMDGRRALVYSRIRTNELDWSETDFARAQRQQQVVQATLDAATSIGMASRLPSAGGALVSPLATDLGAWDILQLGWVYVRADSAKALHCRLGGDAQRYGGASVIVPSEDNASVIAMFLGQAAPLAPPKGLPYAPGCRRGTR